MRTLTLLAGYRFGMGTKAEQAADRQSGAKNQVTHGGTPQLDKRRPKWRFETMTRYRWAGSAHCSHGTYEKGRPQPNASQLSRCTRFL